MDGDIQPITEWPITANEDEAETKPITEKFPLDRYDKVLSTECHPVNEETQQKRKSIQTCPQQNIKRVKMSLATNDRSPEVVSRTALARWWRRAGKHLIPASDLPETNNANTLLHYISRCKPGMAFLHSEQRRLQNKLDSGQRYADVYTALGTVEECLGELTQAKIHLQQAVQMDPDNKEYKWHLHKITRQHQVELQQKTMLQQLSGSGSDLHCLPVKQVKRVSARDLSMKEFFYHYSLTSTPVIITDLVDKMTDTPWTLQHISQVAGDVKVTLKRPVCLSVEWAGLEEGERITVKEYIDQIIDKREGADHSQTDQYLFDWSLPLHCPQLVQELTIPRYFAGDLLQRTSSSSLYQDSWPSLFIAPAGLCSQLHIDAFASNFWMALFQGKKRWTFFSPSDVPCLYPQYVHSMDPVFEVDVNSPDLDHFPLMSLAQPLQCDLLEGEVLFVPSGCPHHVENLQDSLAISANFVDLSNVDAVKQELGVSSLIDPRAEELLEQLQDSKFPKNMDSSIEDKPWKHFKSWNSENYEKYDITVQSIQDCTYV